MKITKDFIFVDLTEDRAKHMGAVWNNSEDKYRLPNTIGVMKELKLMGHDLGPELEKKKKARNYVMQLKSREDVEGSTKLRPYQRVDVDYLKRIGSAGIFNEQRTGKTPTTLTLVKEKEFERIVVVCPASLVLNWKEEVEKWTEYETFPSVGTLKKRKAIYHQYSSSNYAVLIIGYETLRNDLDILIREISRFDCLIVDEAHRLRSLIKGRTASQTARAVRSLGRKANVRYALTGTPVVRDGQEIWGILNFLFPEKFPGYWQFVDRYFNVVQDTFGQVVAGYKRKNELQDILSVMSVNRKRREVMKWLPRKQYQKITLPMNTKQKKVYEDVRDTFEYENIIDAPSVLAQLTRLRQIATSPNLLVQGVTNEKEKFILDWIEDNKGEKVIIFSTFSSYLKELYQKLRTKEPGTAMIIGETTKINRDRYVRLFQDPNSGHNILLCNIKAAGTGLTLDAGETIIFLDKEYNPADNEQAEDRIVPTTEERNHSMTIISLVMQDSVDEMIHDLLEQKTDITKVINDGGIQAIERLWKTKGVPS